MPTGATILEESRCNRCEDCGEPKPRGPGHRLCVECKSKHYTLYLKRIREKNRKPCARCGGEKEEGQGTSKYCVKCREIKKTCSKCKRIIQKRYCMYCERAPCADCGGEKLPGRGYRLCQECLDLQKWRSLKRKEIRQKKDNQRNCVVCKRLIRDKGRKYCQSCREKRAERMCMSCGVNPPRGMWKKYCPSCYYDSLILRRERCNENQRIRRSDPVWREQEQVKDRIRRAKRSKEAKQRVLESGRINYRLKNDSARVVSMETYKRKYSYQPRHSRLPLAPLLPYLRNQIPPESLLNSDGKLKELADLSGVDSSFIRRCLKEQQPTLRLADADRMCIAMDLMLCDVYGLDIDVGRGAAVDAV